MRVRYFVYIHNYFYVSEVSIQECVRSSSRNGDVTGYLISKGSARRRVRLQGWIDMIRRKLGIIGDTGKDLGMYSV